MSLPLQQQVNCLNIITVMCVTFLYCISSWCVLVKISSSEVALHYFTDGFTPIMIHAKLPHLTVSIYVIGIVVIWN